MIHIKIAQRKASQLRGRWDWIEKNTDNKFQASIYFLISWAFFRKEVGKKWVKTLQKNSTKWRKNMCYKFSYIKTFILYTVPGITIYCKWNMFGQERQEKYEGTFFHVEKIPTKTEADYMQWINRDNL